MQIEISGIHEEDDFIKSKLNEEIGHTIDKLGKMLNITSFVMHVKKYHETGNKKKYSIQARLLTDDGDFFADDFAWELTKAAKGVLQKLETEVIRKVEKEKDKQTR
jgi:ribosome-associated translation inhibitor RaiA